MQLERLVTFERSDVAAEDIVIREELVPLLPDRFSLFVSVSLSLSLPPKKNISSQYSFSIVCAKENYAPLSCHHRDFRLLFTDSGLVLWSRAHSA